MSIRIRLTLGYVGVLTAILIVFSAVVYTSLSFSLLRAVDRTLQDRAAQVGSVIAAQNDPLTVLRTGLIDLPALDVFSTPAAYIQVVRGDGSVARRSQNLGDQRLPLDADLLAVNLRNQPALKTLVLENGVRLRMVSVPISVAGQVVGAVQVGQPLTDLDAALKRVLVLLMVGTLVTIIAAGGVGLLMSWLSLRPIDRITQTAGRIVRAQDLGRRLPVPTTDDEVGRLVSTFNAMLERLDRLFQAQQRLGADVSHELRTPLTTIRGNVDLLRRGAATDPTELALALEAIEGEVDRMNRLVADLLLLAQAEADMKLEKQPVELDTLILQVYRQAQLMSATHFPIGERVSIHLGHEDQAVVEGDPDRIKQLLLNLIDNALKYTPPGGQITISLYRDQDWVRVSVEDTGVGIPSDVLPHIFDRFYRAQRKGRKGVGLGLSIARWIAEAHNGRLTVESQVGQGTTFTLWLPT
ncbi:MAG: HAMP domain-containing histidine kinase [Anaerolineales bacterium]|nr:MAG: HAMP domain-containing histidine kinase [Anaerolineales bacterium]